MGFLAPGTRGRRVALWAGVVVVALVYTQFFLEGTKGGGRGTPTAVLFSGLVAGMLSALTATGLVLIYRVNRIINFAQGAIGTAGAVLILHLVRYQTHFPFPLSFLIGMALAAGVGVLIDLVFGRRFATSPRLVLTVVSIAAAAFVVALATTVIVRLSFWPKFSERGRDDLNVVGLQRRLPFPGFHFRVGSLPQRFGFVHVLSLEVAVVLLVALAVFLRYTRAGVAMRAVAQNTERAALLGISVGALSTAVWGIAGLLSGATETLGALSGTGSNGLRFANLLPPLAAAVLARMRSVPVAVASAVIISIVSTATLFSVREAQPLIDLGLLVAVGVALLAQRRDLFRSEQAVETSWSASQEPRAIPTELRSVRSLQVARVAIAGIGLAAVGLFPFLVATRIVSLFSVIALTGIAGISLVVLTGWAGQVSLGQFAFVAVGAVAAGWLNDKANVPFWFAVPLATAFTAAASALIGIPALRIRGLFLAITTFAFAVAVASLLGARRYVGSSLPRTLGRPTLFLFNFEDERSMYFLCIAALIVVMVIVANLRRTRFGRMLIAMRENEPNMQSFGVSLVRTKLLAFAFAGGLAGFAGAIYAFQQRGVDGSAFGAERSFQLFVFTVLGGVSSTAGAGLGAVFQGLTTYFFATNFVVGNLVVAAPLALLYVQPGGLVGIVNSLRDGVLRIVAQRRQLVVPSLFADYDAEALERRLIPLGEPSTSGGLGALPAGHTYARESHLYGADRVLAIERRDADTEEALAIGAAASNNPSDGA